jgi:hypothetical protein
VIVALQTNIESHCKRIYQEANAFFEKRSIAAEFGLKILYGPPYYEPPILFIGYQPGGGALDFARETARVSDTPWSGECEYATRDYPLADHLRNIFGVDFLAKCVGLNAIFVRSPRMRTYVGIDRAMRKEIETFCVARANRIVDIIKPKKIVVIGFAALGLFDRGTVDVTSPKGRVLTKIGEVAGHPAIATLHLSGAHISACDRKRIGDRIQTL